MAVEEKQGVSVSQGFAPSGDAGPVARAAGEAGGSAAERFLPRRWLADYGKPPLPLAEGVTYAAWHPFIRGSYLEPDGYDEPASGALFQAPQPHATWQPGWSYEACGPHGEDSEEVWGGEGVQLRTIVSIHKPGRFPTRVFYTRQWRDPDGKVFGKTSLRVVVAPTFRHWLMGERWPVYSPSREAHIAWASHSSELRAPRAEGTDAALSAPDEPAKTLGEQP